MGIVEYLANLSGDHKGRLCWLSSFSNKGWFQAVNRNYLFLVADLKLKSVKGTFYDFIGAFIAGV